jgi:APA family basic amino acid/polyamine antiporter
MTTTPGNAPELRRSIRTVHATSMVVGTIIGASIFVQPSEITGQVPSLAGIFGVWVSAGLLTLFGALACAELASAFPATGGVYVFLRETWGRPLGFLWGWAMFWSMHSGIIAAIAVVFARYVGFFTPLGTLGTRLVAVGAILALSAVNYVGVRAGSRLQTAFTVAKVGAVIVITVLAFALGGRVSGHFVPASDAAAGVGLQDFAMAVAAGLFAFGGWHMVTYSAGETEDARRTIPRALLWGTLTVTACYMALNAAYLYVLPLDTVASSTRVAADAAERLVGPRGAAAISGLVVFSTFGALSGIVLVGPRVYLSMARDGLLFRWLGDVHPRFRTPHRAVALQAVWASVLAATGTYRGLFTRVIYTEWIFFGLMAAGLFVLRRRGGYSPSYRMWGYPWSTALFVAISFLVVANHLRAAPTESVTGLLIVAAGLPVYMLWPKPATSPSRSAE